MDLCLCYSRQVSGFTPPARPQLRNPLRQLPHRHRWCCLLFTIGHPLERVTRDARRPTKCTKIGVDVTAGDSLAGSVMSAPHVSSPASEVCGRKGGRAAQLGVVATPSQSYLAVPVRCITSDASHTLPATPRWLFSLRSRYFQQLCAAACPQHEESPQQHLDTEGNRHLAPHVNA